MHKKQVEGYPKNHQHWLSRNRALIKRICNQGYFWAMTAIHAPYFLIRHGVKCTLEFSFEGVRGMDLWRDIIDWLGDYPFEVARPVVVFAFYRKCGFMLKLMVIVDGRDSCNELDFCKQLSGV